MDIFLEYFFAISNLLQRAFWVSCCKKLWWKHFPSLIFVSRKARSFWRRWTNMEMVFCIFMCLYSFEHYTTLYMPRQFRACICICLLCQKFPVATAANLCYLLPFVFAPCCLQWSFLIFNSIHITGYSNFSLDHIYSWM